MKALYGLKKAPRAWCERLCSLLVRIGFTRGIMDTTLFRKAEKGKLLIVQIYIDDIIFGATSKRMCKDFSELMKGEVDMWDS